MVGTCAFNSVGKKTTQRSITASTKLIATATTGRRVKHAICNPTRAMCVADSIEQSARKALVDRSIQVSRERSPGAEK